MELTEYHGTVTLNKVMEAEHLEQSLVYESDERIFAAVLMNHLD